MTYQIAMLGDLIIATASTDELLRQRAEAEIKMNGLTITLDPSNSAFNDVRPATFDDLKIIGGLTLYKTTDDAEADAAEIVYSGTDMGWLQDDDGQSIYDAAAVRP